MGDFFIEQMRFSYSSVSTYEQCPMAFFQTYVMKRKTEDNFFGQYGKFIHLLLEKYFAGELDIFTLPDFYSENYDAHVVLKPPHFQPQLADSYRRMGQKFFDNMGLDRNDYDVVLLEPYIKTEDAGVELTVKPDVVLRAKDTGKIIHVDYKTSNFYRPNGKIDCKKFSKYETQAVLYATYIEKVLKILIDEIAIWSIRLDKFEKVDYNKERSNLVRLWFLETIESIKKEAEWDTKPEEYFCNNICGVSKFCPLNR